MITELPIPTILGPHWPISTIDQRERLVGGNDGSFTGLPSESVGGRLLAGLRLPGLGARYPSRPEMMVTVHPQESRLTPILLTRNPTSGFQDV